ncbi:MAG TPA: hypothetical protein VF250_08015 [Conexibacter sp.]
MERRVPNASPLRARTNQGLAAEDATHDAAALWGLPDFVFRAGIRKVGSGVRELGDGILLVGTLGMVVQVKSRVAPSADLDRERRWVMKQTKKALAQAQGTIRQLREEPALMTNARGRMIEVDGNEYRWITVVVIDHADAPTEVRPDLTDIRDPAVVLLRRDWEFIFNQLKSTHAVGVYFERVASDSIELGMEPARYYEIANSAAHAEPDPFDHALLVEGAELFSGPLFPLAPAASEDLPAHHLLRSIFEDIALVSLTRATESDRLRALAALDQLPVSQRAEIGNFLLRAFASVATEPPPGVKWQLRTVRGAQQIHFAFGAASRYSHEIQSGFSAWAQLRHHELHEITGDNALTTVAVLLTPRADGTREWDTTLSAMTGDLKLTDEELAAYRAVWGNAGESRAA